MNAPATDPCTCPACDGTGISWIDGHAGEDCGACCGTGRSCFLYTLDCPAHPRRRCDNCDRPAAELHHVRSVHGETDQCSDCLERAMR